MPPILTGPKAPLQYPYPIRQPIHGDKENNFQVLLDLYQASTQPHQYLPYSGVINGSNKVFVIPTGNINLTLVFVDGVFIHPADYTVTHTATTTTITLTGLAPATNFSITGM